MLGWLAAAAIPWFLHRFFRRQHQTTPWAAIELLLSAVQQKGRHVQLQQWLLLAVRTAILVLLALAVAEPALRQWAVGANEDSQIHRILVVDQSYSMGCQQQGISRWQRALTHARQWIEGSDGKAISLIGWSRQAENLLGRPTLETSVALAALQNLRLSNKSADLPTVARSILATLDRAEAEMPHIRTHQVVFCTDMSRQTWSFDKQQQQLLEAIGKRAKVTLVNVADEQLENLAITDLAIDPKMTLQQHNANFSATLTCFGKAPPKEISVELSIEGRSVEQQQVQLQSDSEATVQFEHRFVDEGTHTVQARILGNETGLSSDNTRWLIVDVRPKLRVACFAGYPGATDDLARALAPTDGLIENEGTIHPELFFASQLGEIDLSKYAAVLLGSVTEFSTRESAALTEYVRQGGGLAIFLGPEIASRSLGDLQPLLPVEVEPLQPEGEYRFDPRDYRHPIVAPFRGQAHSGLLSVTVSQYCRLKLPNERSSIEVVLHFDTGDPALVVERFGLGRVAVSALPGALATRTANGAPWSSFALSPSFLPVVQELVAYLVGDRWLQQRNLLVGETAIFSGVPGAMAVSVRMPGGGQQSLLHPSAEDRGQVIFRETDNQGVYRFHAGEQECARFASNLDGRDSDLRPIDPTKLPTSFSTQTLESSTNATLATGEFTLARTLLATALVLLLLENGLAWLLGRGWG